MKPLNELAKEIHQNNIEKGFFEEPKNIGEMLMLTVTELAEAMEADRKGHIANVKGFTKDLSFYTGEESDFKQFFSARFEDCIKNSFEDEIADSIIRLLDLAAFKGIDIEWHISEKMKYNKTRPFKHGKNY